MCIYIYIYIYNVLVRRLGACKRYGGYFGRVKGCVAGNDGSQLVYIIIYIYIYTRFEAWGPDAVRTLPHERSRQPDRASQGEPGRSGQADRASQGQPDRSGQSDQGSHGEPGRSGQPDRASQGA